MTSEVVIEPVTRIEGHARIVVTLDESGDVADAQFQVTQFRGFERLCQGRPVWEMPSLTARICGICPVSHLIASARACDEILGVRVPPAAVRLRQVLNYAQLVQSHALSFFYLSAPDLLFGFDADPRSRNLMSIAEHAPELARDGIALRRFGQQVIERLAGKRIHPAFVVPGGVSRPLPSAERDAILAEIPEARARAARTLAWFRSRLAEHAEAAAHFGDFPSLYLALVRPGGLVGYSGGSVRLIDAGGAPVLDGADPRSYPQWMGEHVEPWTYLKSPYYAPLGFPGGRYRVGPLARLNVADRLGTAAADTALAEYRERLGRYPSSSFHYHEARLIEVVHGIDAIEQLLEEPEVLDEHVRSRAAVNANEGVGVAEAPRGFLLHHYGVDDDGLVTSVNLVIATGHNNLAMNQAVADVARRYVHGPDVTEGALNRVEAVIRCFDPCLSCSTHAVGQMPLVLEVRGSDGGVLATHSR